MREIHSGNPGMSVYVGGVPHSMGPPGGLIGCFRGLRMGDSIFPLGDSAATGIDMGKYSLQPHVCQSFPLCTCRNY